MQNKFGEDEFDEDDFDEDDYEDDDFDEDDYDEDDYEDDEFVEDELPQNKFAENKFAENKFDSKPKASETAQPKKKKKKSSAEKKQALAVKQENRLNHRLALTNVIAISFTMCIATAFMLFGERPTESREENRALAKRPTFTIASYFDGSFTSQYAEYFNDAVPLRSKFRNIVSSYRAAMGIDYDDGVEIHGTVTLSNNTPEPEVTEPETENMTIAEDEPVTEVETQIETEIETEEPTIPPNEYADADGEVANSVLIVKDRGMQLFGGTNEACETYASYVNQYKKKLGDSVNVYSMVIPTAVSFYLPKKYESASMSEPECIDHINECLKDVIPVDSYSILMQHRNEAIYSRTDHHWQPLGAYYGAQALAETAGVPFADLSEYEEKRRDDYVGTLYSFTNSMALKNNPEPFIYYVPKCQYSTTYYDNAMQEEWKGDLIYDIDEFSPVGYYLVFMYGDDRVTHVHTQVHNNRVLCIIKDSYANAMIPCLTSSFSDIWVVDMRYFKRNIISFLARNGVTDLVFAMSSFSAVGVNYEHLNTLLNQ